jgi:pimeloyl-ACP methyl ester carboxylesterase
VSIVFGAADPYLTVHVARWFARLFPQADLQLVRGARHYIKVDEPKLVATAVLAAGRRDRATSPAPP